MTEFADIINTPIIDKQTDAFWTDDMLPAGIAPVPVLIITDATTDNPASSAALKKMLDACALPEASYYIINLADTQHIAWHKLQALAQPKVVLLLGATPASLGISAVMPMNDANHFGNSIWIISSSVGDWEKQPDIKRQLWTGALKPVFIDDRFGK